MEAVDDAEATQTPIGRQTPTKRLCDRGCDAADEDAVAACLRPISAPSSSMFMRLRRAANASPLEQPHASGADASQDLDSGSIDDDADEDDGEDACVDE